jgi:type I restriction enzyme M protein
MYENAFNAIEKSLRSEAGIANELDYVEQISWVLFLKYLHDLETERQDRAELSGEEYSPIISGEHAWDKWAAPKKDGEFDHNAAKIGDDLIAYVDGELFPYLAKFRETATGPKTIEYKIGEIFTELRSKFRSGYILRGVLEIADGLEFNTQAQRHELSELYETRIRRMGNAGRNGGEYYTPRPLIRAMIKVLDPKIGETIYDGAVGSAGFLCEAYEYMRTDTLSAKQYKTLQERTFYGKEKKSLAYVIAIMNMILHGIEAPNIVHTNTLTENLADIQERDRFDVVLANPPFGGKERKEVQQNFPSARARRRSCSCSTSSRCSRPAGGAAWSSRTRSCRTPITPRLALAEAPARKLQPAHDARLPRRHVPGRGCEDRGAVLRERDRPRKVWFYQLDPGRSLGKTNPLNDDD